MQSMIKSFKCVKYLRDERNASEIGDDQVALLLYRSNLLGSDLRITNYGGGNTSCKTIRQDPLSGEDVEIMYVKGSGGDIGTLTKAGLAGPLLTYRKLKVREHLINERGNKTYSTGL